MIREVISHRRAKVLNGVAVLDDLFGREWVAWVDPEKLDLASGSRCVLGQVFGSGPDGDVGYFVGVEALGLDANEVIIHGFDIASMGSTQLDRESYEGLTYEWQKWFAEQKVPAT